jgi:hypothetical protein
MFVFLSDVPEELGPPHLVSSEHTAGLATVPNWFLRQGADAGRGGVALPGLDLTAWHS